MKRKENILLISAICLVIAGISIAVYMYNKPHISVAEASPKAFLEAQVLVGNFQNNENQANSEYLEQIIQVTGKISELDTADGNGVITLSGESSFGSVMCNLPPEENQKMVGLKEGQNVTIKGICTGYLMDVVLINCVIINLNK